LIDLTIFYFRITLGKGGDNSGRAKQAASDRGGASEGGSGQDRNGSEADGA